MNAKGNTTKLLTIQSNYFKSIHSWQHNTRYLLSWYNCHFESLFTRHNKCCFHFYLSGVISKRKFVKEKKLSNQSRWHQVFYTMYRFILHTVTATNMCKTIFAEWQHELKTTNGIWALMLSPQFKCVNTMVEFLSPRLPTKFLYKERWNDYLQKVPEVGIHWQVYLLDY